MTLISGIAGKPDGSLLVNSTVRFYRKPLLVTSQNGRVVMPTPVVIVTGVAGAVSFNLEPGNYTGVDVATDTSFNFPVPNIASVDWSAVVGSADVVLPSTLGSSNVTMTGGGTAQDYAGFATRAAFVTWASGKTPAVGTIIDAAGFAYRYIGSGTAISDLAGYVPVEPALPEHWGAVADGDNASPTDNGAALVAWATWINANAKEITGLVGNYATTQTVSFNNVRRGIDGLHLIAHPSITPETYLMALDGNIGMVRNCVLRCQDLANGIDVTNARGTSVSNNRIEKPKSYGIHSTGDWTDALINENFIQNYNAAAKVATGIYIESNDVNIRENILQLMLVGVNATGYGVYIEENHIYQGVGGGAETTPLTVGVQVEGDNVTVSRNNMDKCCIKVVNGVARAAATVRRSIAIEDNKFYSQANYATVDGFIQFDRNAGVSTQWREVIVRGNKVRNSDTSTGLRLITANGAGAYTVLNNDISGNIGDINMGQSGINLISDRAHVILTGDYVLANTTAAQQIFNSSTNGAIFLETGVYEFTAMVGVQGMSATSGSAQINLLGAGSAVLANIFFHAVGQDQNSPVSTSAQNGSFSFTAASLQPIVAAGVNTGLGVTVTGTFVITTAGTLIPSIALGTAIATATVKAGTSFRARKLAPSDTLLLGEWT